MMKLKNKDIENVSGGYIEFVELLFRNSYENDNGEIITGRASVYGQYEVYNDVTGELLRTFNNLEDAQEFANANNVTTQLI